MKNTVSPLQSVLRQISHLDFSRVSYDSIRELADCHDVFSVPEGVSVNVEISSCRIVNVMGEARIILPNADFLHVGRHAKCLASNASVQEAHVEGVYEGRLQVSGKLVVRKGARLSGEIFYQEIEVENGGLITGAMTRIERSDENTVYKAA